MMLGDVADFVRHLINAWPKDMIGLFEFTKFRIISTFLKVMMGLL